MFDDLKAKITIFKDLAPVVMQDEVEVWYRKNIELGGEQVKGGLVKPFHPRRRGSQGHPMLQNTGGLLRSIKAQYSRNKIKVSHNVTNYRGKRDYGKIHNKYGTPTKMGATQIVKIVRPFMRDSRPLADHVEKKIGLMMRNIFK